MTPTVRLSLNYCTCFAAAACRRRLLDELHFAIDAQNLRHLLLELRIAAFQVVAQDIRHINRCEWQLFAGG